MRNAGNNPHSEESKEYAIFCERSIATFYNSYPVVIILNLFMISLFQPDVWFILHMYYITIIGVVV